MIDGRDEETPESQDANPEEQDQEPPSSPVQPPKEDASKQSSTSINAMFNNISLDATQLEVTLRIALCLLLSCIISLGDWPNAVPPSQTVIIGSVTGAFCMVVPTLMFSVAGAVFPGMVSGMVVALLFATALLAAAATGGMAAYVAAYGVMALLLAGLRFHPTQGTQTSVVLMLTALNTMSLAPKAEQEGLSFVSALWTSKGLTNPNASFRNGLIGMCWVCFCIAVPRLLPPWRTSRKEYTTEIIPKILEDVANFIQYTMKSPKTANKSKAAVSEETSSEDNDHEQMKSSDRDEMVANIVHEGAMVIGGKSSGATIFEPRLLRMAPVEWSVGTLQTLEKAISDVIFSSLTLQPVVKDMYYSAGKPAIEKIVHQYEENARMLKVCAKRLRTSHDDDDNNNTSENDNKQEEQPMDNNTDGREGEEAAPNEEVTEYSWMWKSVPASIKPKFGAIKRSNDDKPSDQEAPMSCLTLVEDPVRLTARTTRLENATREWMAVAGPPVRCGGLKAYFGNPARQAMVKFVLVWLMAGGVGLVLAIFKTVQHVVLPSTWQSIAKPPYKELPKAIWCVKFAVGFTALVAMTVYWPAFASLEINVNDTKGPHFAGWHLIAYAFATTQTVEGTWKKGTLRFCATALGGFSAWLALTACGTNPYGLTAWLTIMGTIAAYIGLPKGAQSRGGLNPDFAWGPAYFAMTQSLVVLEVYAGLGGKNDITINRIVANAVGIAMAMFLAAIPPGIYGGSPHGALSLLGDNKKMLVQTISLLLGDDAGMEKEELSQQFKVLRSTNQTKFVAMYTEVTGNYKDANQLQSLPILKLDNPKLPRALDSMGLLGSNILVIADMCARLADEGVIHKGLGGTDSSVLRNDLQSILDDLDRDTRNDGSNQEFDDAACTATSGKTLTEWDILVSHVKIVYPVLRRNERNLNSVKWGFFPKWSDFPKSLDSSCSPATKVAATEVWV